MSVALDYEDDTIDSARSPRQPRTQRKTLAGLDLDPENEAEDDEYNEDYDESVVKDDEEDEDDEEEEEIDVDLENDENDDNEDNYENDDNDDNDENPRAEEADGAAEEKAPEEDAAVVPEVPVKKKRGRKRKVDIEAELAAKRARGETTEGPEGVPAEGTEVRKKGKKRGRKPKIPRPDDVHFDDKGNEIDVKNDEIVLPDEDPKGREKIDDNGFLQGDRKFRIRTFTLLGKGDRQYMVSTEPARMVGFRDSYLLFKTHLSLFKKVCTHDEKMDLINRQLIPTSYKGRAVNLVTARSIFREFGARMVVGGRKVTDDFWEEKARERGDVEGELADLEDPVIKVPSYNAADSAYVAQVTGSALVNYQADKTWMFQMAQQTVEYNKQLAEARATMWTRGSKDAYSGFNFYPTSSQPRRARVIKVAAATDADAGVQLLGWTTRFYNPDVRKRVTGLADVPREVYDSIEDEAVREAIRAQQEYERLLV